MRDCTTKGTVQIPIGLSFDLEEFNIMENLKIEYEFQRDTLIPENRQVESLEIVSVEPDWVLQALGKEKIKTLCLQLVEYQE